jgi:hypothetical protein
MSPLRLSDDQMNAILGASTPLAPNVREAFLHDVVAALSRMPELGDGSLHRTLMVLQRKYFSPPLGTEAEDDRGGRRRGVSKYASGLV